MDSVGIEPTFFECNQIFYHLNYKPIYSFTRLFTDLRRIIEWEGVRKLTVY